MIKAKLEQLAQELDQLECDLLSKEEDELAKKVGVFAPILWAIAKGMEE